MDRIRNARHFAPRLQRWLDEIGAMVCPLPSAVPGTSKTDEEQLDRFAQDVFLTRPAAPNADPGPPWFGSGAPPVTPAHPPHPAHLPHLAAAPAADGPPRLSIHIGGQTLDYVLLRSTRRSIGFRIDDKGLRVTAPKRITYAEIEHAIRAKQGWILSKLHERGERRALRQSRAPVAWIDGARLLFMGADIILRLQPATRSHCRFDAASGELWVGVVPGLSEWQLKERIRLWFLQEAKRVFAERLAEYAPRLGVTFNSLTLSSAGTRWGSCTTEGNIRLNWRLIHFSLPLIDYVVAHELSHLREMNHSARFWATVESVYADYDGARAALRQQSQSLPHLFT